MFQFVFYYIIELKREKKCFASFNAIFEKCPPVLPLFWAINSFAFSEISFSKMNLICSFFFQCTILSKNVLMIKFIVNTECNDFMHLFNLQTNHGQWTCSLFTCSHKLNFHAAYCCVLFKGSLHLGKKVWSLHLEKKVC